MFTDFYHGNVWACCCPTVSAGAELPEENIPLISGRNTRGEEEALMWMRKWSSVFLIYIYIHIFCCCSCLVLQQSEGVTWPDIRQCNDLFPALSSRRVAESHQSLARCAPGARSTVTGRNLQLCWNEAQLSSSFVAAPCCRRGCAHSCWRWDSCLLLSECQNSFCCFQSPHLCWARTQICVDCERLTYMKIIGLDWV